MAAGVNVLLSGFIQIVLFLYVNKTLSEKKEWFRNGKKKFYFYSLKYLSPLLILIILFTRIYDDLTTSFDLSKGIRWSWFLLVWIAAYFFSKKSTRSLKKNLQEYLS
jgi:CDP-diglyceride synthetase